MRRTSIIFAGLALAASVFPIPSAYAFKDSLLNSLLSFHEQCIKQGGSFSQPKPLIFQCVIGSTKKTCDYNGIVSCKSSSPASAPAKPS
jgi:hypothetical protein